MRLLHRLLPLVLITCCRAFVFGQSTPAMDSFVKPLDSLSARLPIEKLYLHLDKPNYTAGDTIWFKAYLLNADRLTPSDRSGLLYVELDDATDKCLNRIMVPIASGLSWGNITLDPKEIPDGSYTLRAYTNWMRNFGDDYVFKQQLYISSVTDPLLISANIKKTKQGPKDSIQAALMFHTLDKQPARLMDMQLKVMEGTKTLYRYKGTTTLEGKLNLNFTLADSRKKAFIVATQSNKKDDATELIIPVNANRPENTDLQFMPEGGKLVIGLPTRVAFKAIGEDGKGTNVEGNIYNNKQELITDFKSRHKGMGTFEITPQPGDSYTAVLALPDGTKKSYPLPVAALTGTCLRASPKGADSLQIAMSVTTDLIAKGSYYLVAHAAGQTHYAAVINFKHQLVKLVAPTAVFPTGIIHFTLLDASHQPLNERIVYIDHHDDLRINIVPNSAAYSPHDSIAINVQVTNSDGKPVRGAFSMAVTDDNQVKTDTTGSNILNSMLLTDDLKGDVEEPGYYFANTNPQTITALDNLLLTQGWVGYNWKQVFSPVKQPGFAAEKEFLIQGKVTNMFNKGVAKSGLLLMAHKPTIIIDTLTGDDGRFTFRGLAPVDTPSYLIQARNKRGKSFNVGIDVDEFKPPVFTPAAFITAPWYVNTDTTALRNLDAVQAKQIALEKMITSGQVLRNVVITAKKIVKESKNLNGSGEADLVLDEKDMEKAGKMTLQELLEQKLKGFKEYGIWSPGPGARSRPWYYVLGDRSIHFIFDGVDVNFLANGDNKGLAGEERGRFLRDYLQYYTAEDIKGIEVMSTSKYISRYGSQFLEPLDYSFVYAFIEITTRGGVGPFLRKTPGITVYKPLPFSYPKQFYSPRYPVKTKPAGTDLRSTIYWQPNFITDATGCATIGFYTADRPGKYTIIVQGANLAGSLGYQRGSVVVK